MKLSFFVGFLFLSKIGTSQPIFDSKTYSKWVTKIEHIDPKECNFDDLQFLKQKLENKQIIILGENGHGDGAAFQAKTRLIKYLTSQLDYKTIAFEGGGLFEMYYANLKSTNQDQFVTEIQKSWFRIWSNSAQTKELINYLYETRDKIKYVGIENQAGNDYWTEFPAIVKELIGERAFDGINYETFNSNFLHFYQSYFIDTSYASLVDIPQLQLDLNTIRQNISKTQNQASQTLIQSIFNIEGFIQQMKLNFGSYSEQNQSISLRDSLMTENVKWWLRNNPNQKLIIWTANFHAVDQLYQTTYAEGDDFYQVMKPLGQRLRAEFGDKLFTIAFTSSDGNNATIYETESQPIITASDSWEYELSKQINFDYAFVDFGQIRRKKKYHNYAFNSSLLGYRNRLGPWLNMFDSVFYIRTMKRSDLDE